MVAEKARPIFTLVALPELPNSDSLVLLLVMLCQVCEKAAATVNVLL
jgi:hypothetical protein